jgi:hypothetical protein
MTRTLASLGWREWVGLPDLGVKRVKVKVDTGARSSSLHAEDIELLGGRGAKRVRFRVCPIQRSREKSRVCEAELHDERWIKSSNGKSELRPVIRTRVSWNGEQWAIDLTHTSRDIMGFRMLLGREAVRGRYLVDAGHSFLGKKAVKARRSKK